MKTMNLKPLLFATFTLAFTSPAFAVLGQRASSVDTVRVAMNAKVKSLAVNSTLYTSQELDSNGTTVREFLTADGVVFAVAWKGVLEPDLSVLLGDYNSEYVAGQKQIRRTHMTQRLSNVKTSNVSVSRQGHMRAWHGLAYVTRLVPAGVSVDSLSF